MWRVTYRLECDVHIFPGLCYIGFALVNEHPNSGLEVDCNMAEFFIVRRCRRSGLGKKAVYAIFSAYPGLWEVAVARRNTGAIVFWRKTITAFPDVRKVEESDVNDYVWNGTIFRFWTCDLPAK